MKTKQLCENGCSNWAIWPKDLSIIIVNWNTRDYLANCLATVAVETSNLDYEVIVVDNASCDGSVEMLQTRYPDVHVIPNRENLGFARANNQGLALARGRHVLLLNPDTEVRDRALERMVAFLDSNPGAAVVGPRLTLAKGRVQGGAAGYEPSPWTLFNFSFFLYQFFPRWCRGLWLARRSYDTGEPILVDWVSGAALMARASAIQQVGAMDESYFMYAEDVEWCHRFREAGWAVYCLPTATVVHHIGRSTRQRGASFFATNVNSLDRYYRHRYGPATVALMHFFGACGFLLRYLLYGGLYLWRRWPIYAEVQGQWRACLIASIQRMFGPERPSPVPLAKAAVAAYSIHAEEKTS